jgi:uncharacterized protein with GYD domain
MATYITLLKFTDQGIKGIKESPARMEKAKALAKSLGCDVKSFHVTLGSYDIVGLFEAPNDDAIAKFVLAAGALGNVKSETMRALSEDEFRKIVAALP